jgi:hypothetical protein
MFDEILGLPAHALIIHAAVLFTPLLSVAAVAYVLLTRWRRRLAWAVVLLAVAAPLSVFAARQSGPALEHRVFPDGVPATPAGQRVLDHESFALPLLLSTIGLGLVALLLVYFSARAGELAASPAEARHAAGASAGRTTVTMTLSVVTVLLAIAALYFVIRAGHSGATAVWGS